jgi:hypothetical protein
MVSPIGFDWESGRSARPCEVISTVVVVGSRTRLKVSCYS